MLTVMMCHENPGMNSPRVLSIIEPAGVLSATISLYFAG